MKRVMIFGLGVGLMLLLFAGVSLEPVTDKFEVKFWNGSYWAKGRFPDSSTFELKSRTDLTYTAWKAKIVKAWADSQEPPGLPILYETNDYAIRDPNDGNLVLEWKSDGIRLIVTKKSLPALVDSTKQMETIFAGML